MNGDEFSIIQENAVTLVLRVDQATNTITLDKTKSDKGHFDKEILYGNQTAVSAPAQNSGGGNSGAHFFGTKTPQQ